MIEITITERNSFGSEKLIATRRLEVESKKQLTQQRAKKILAREYSELGGFIPLVKRGPGFVTSKAIKPTEKCSYHFVWRDYYIVDSNA